MIGWVNVQSQIYVQCFRAIKSQLPIKIPIYRIKMTPFYTRIKFRVFAEREQWKGQISSGMMN